MSAVDLSIITVTFNSQNEVKKWVESIEKTVSKYSFEMIVSDNSPNSETEKVVLDLQKKHPELIYVNNHGNLGFSKGNNVAIKKAKGRYLLFLNPDMEVGEGTIDGALSFLIENEDAGSVTPAVYLPDGGLDDSCHRGFPTPWNSFTYFSGLSRKFPKIKIFAGYNLTYMDFTKIHTIDSLAGSFLIISRDLGEKLKWWDPDYFFYGEDIDFCYRINKAGYKIYYLPTYKALHHKGMSSGIKDVSKEKSNATNETKIWATIQRFKAMEIFYKKHYEKKYPWLINKLIFLAIKTKRMMALRNLQS
jgi:GT2 family glycosyltransferase